MIPAMATATKQVLSLQKSLALKPIGENVFINIETPYVPSGARGIFGGTIAAQALYAALHTVPVDFVPHSLHSYFLLSGDVKKKVRYEVGVLRDGNSFMSRHVRAYQDEKVIFTQNVSFMNTKPKRPLIGQLDHGKDYPEGVDIKDFKQPIEVIKNSKLLNQSEETKPSEGGRGTVDDQAEEVWKRYEKGTVEHLLPDDFYDIIEDESHPHYNKEPHEKELNMFCKVNEKIDDPRFHYVALTYYADALFLITSMKFHNRGLFSQVMSVSLDHVVYFHKPFDANKWQLYHIKHPKSGGGRNFMYGEFYDEEDKSLIATVTQEGYVVIDGETNKKGKVKSKL